MSFTEFATLPGSDVDLKRLARADVAEATARADVAQNHERRRPSPQHSPMLGQCPLSQMVCNLCSDTMLRTSLYASPVGSLTRNHLGLSTRALGGVVGRWRCG